MNGLLAVEPDAPTPPPPDAHAVEIVENAPSAMLLTTLDGRIVASNATARALLGWNEAQLRAKGHHLALVVPKDTLDAFLARRDRAGHASAVVTLRRGDGSTFLADAVSTCFTSLDGQTLCVVSFRDATAAERDRRALVILAEAGAVLSRSLDPRVTLKNLTDLVVPRLADACTVDLVEADGVARAAVAHRDMSKIPAFEHVRRRKISPSADAGTDYVLRTGKVSCVTELSDAWLRRATLDPSHFDEARALGVQSFVSVPLVAHERTIGALTLMSDGGAPPFDEASIPLVRALAERAALAIDNAQRHAEAVEARRLRDEVLGVVAHDLRGPLNTILLATRIIARERESHETHTIQRAVARANVLIHDLLLAAKTDSGALPIERRREGMASILDEVHAIHAPIALARQVDFVVEVRGAAELAQADVDRHRVVQLLSNLVSNAIEVTPEGGSVRLVAHGEPDHVVLEVSDTGRGIAADDLPRVFDRFWQGAHRRRAGAGLGLTIARAIATSHGGDIRVTSTVGRGTTFTVVLPRTAPRSS